MEKKYCGTIIRGLLVIMSMSVWSFIDAASDRQLRGMIRYPDPLAPVPEYTIFFQGYRTKSNAEGFFVLPSVQDSTIIRPLHLIITRNIEYKFKSSNTVEAMMIPEGKPYKYYICDPAGDGSWSIREASLPAQNRVLPQQTLIIRMAPSSIDHVESWNISLPDVDKLPVVVLKPDIAQDKVKRASVKSLLNSLDDGVMHTPYLEECSMSKDPKISSRVKVSLVR